MAKGTGASWRSHAGHQRYVRHPQALCRKKLVSTLKQEIGIPIQLHTHDTSGNQVAACLLPAAEAGVDVVDCAISSMAGMTSQPSMNAVVAALQGTERDTGLDLDRLQYLTDYWEDIRKRYDSFEGGIKCNSHGYLPLRDPRRPVHQPVPAGGLSGVLAAALKRSRELQARSTICWAASLR